MKKEEGIPDPEWFIIKCNNCDGLNLLSPGAGVKEIKFGNYTWVQSLDKNKYSADQAKLKIQQIKNFKKL